MTTPGQKAEVSRCVAPSTSSRIGDIGLAPWAFVIEIVDLLVGDGLAERRADLLGRLVGQDAAVDAGARGLGQRVLRVSAVEARGDAGRAHHGIPLG